MLRSQFTSRRYGERLAEMSAVPSIGSIGDSYAGCVAKIVNGYDKAEPTCGPTRCGPWRTIEGVELATVGWAVGTTPHGCMATSAMYPAEFEAAAWAATQSSQPEVELPALQLLWCPGRPI